MLDPWVVLAVLGGVLLAAVLLAVAQGWRPGGRTRRTETVVQEEIRREFPLRWNDWRKVVRAVRRGGTAPEPLRPVAYELARRLVPVYGRYLAVRRPRLAVAVAVAVGLAVGGLGQLIPTDDVSAVGRVARLVGSVLFALIFVWLVRTAWANAVRALELNG